MAMDRKEYRADKKAYKKNKKQGKAGNKEAAKKNKKSLKNTKAGEPLQMYGYAQNNLLKPNKSDYKPSADDNENKGRGGKGPKPMSRTGRAKASVMKLKDGLVSRFQGSTPKFGKNELMKPVIESLKPTMAIKPKPVKKKVETLTKGQKRSYDLRDAHS